MSTIHPVHQQVGQDDDIFVEKEKNIAYSL